ncbi:programmed cell death 1 ligand 1 [Cololabis saira]|uniref:programmed cell death 1 ligand 1 n=1 Tax=Cololabis saira TaxID=129043 RepID=UPI002AD596FE|nr:programmed cell death 1 ligand 1 [Cololabis saira]
MSSSNSRLLNFPRIALQAVLLVLFGILSESSIHIRYEVEVGGNVTIHCPVEENREIDFLYLQTDKNGFVNGFHSIRPIENTWPNTEMALNNRAVVFYDVKISHSGIYYCIFDYKNNQRRTKEVPLSLSVIAPYSKPSVTSICSQDHLYCHVTCASHDGYPRREMKWNVGQKMNVTSHMWKVLNNSIEKSNSSTGLLSITGTAYFNCSNGELEYNCSVGNANSDNFLICGTEKPPFDVGIVVGSCSVLGVVLMVMLVVLWTKYKKRRLSFLEGVTTDNGGGTKEEIVELKGKNEVNS